MFSAFAELLPDLTELYQNLHRHPELSFEENRTAAELGHHLRDLGYEVTTGVGRTGVVGVLRNGDGPTVMLRADMDALPVTERTGLPYASNRPGVMHACGHDLHCAWLVGAAALLAHGADQWAGTVLLVLQPAEETGGGAEAMVDDGLYERFGRPTVAFGQHVGPAPAGRVLSRPGLMMAASDSLQVRLFGRGGHGAKPESTVDPIVMAAATVLRLQTIVSREIPATDTAVVTVGALHAGTKENIIPDDAELKLSVRTFEPRVRERVLGAITRIVHAEAAAAGAPKPPEVEIMRAFEPVVNDEAATSRVSDAFIAHFGSDRVAGTEPQTGSEDFGVYGARGRFPSVFWFVGGSDPEAYEQAERAGRVDRDIPSNHSPYFAPVLETTLSTGVETLVTAAMAWLTASGSADPQTG
ncbi:amidohydrolase [Planosporangium flavigriseum]|uniref:Hippurate hydrolase n=1 Tax=Planosporangium flavigriseum TaxID=373681 RepID=A0A8J3PPM2_9ACTN|nr:amidohydrolase [Planosporangium flavigriseum]NJC67226.1 amidohydrolase [Planosporangium flavigriseum]GIG75191.1 hippurate hydrolase [Planosporangium flavigriseum]